MKWWHSSGHLRSEFLECLLENERRKETKVDTFHKNIKGSPILSSDTTWHPAPLMEHALYTMVVVWPDSPKEVSKNIFLLMGPIGLMASNVSPQTNTSYLAGVIPKRVMWHVGSEKGDRILACTAATVSQSPVLNCLQSSSKSPWLPHHLFSSGICSLLLAVQGFLAAGPLLVGHRMTVRKDDMASCPLDWP